MNYYNLQQKKNANIASTKYIITSRNNSTFAFRFVSLKEFLDRVVVLNLHKASHLWLKGRKWLKRTQIVRPIFFTFSTMHGHVLLFQLHFYKLTKIVKKMKITDKGNYKFINTHLNLNKLFDSLLFQKIFSFLIKSLQHYDMVLSKVLTQELFKIIWLKNMGNIPVLLDIILLLWQTSFKAFDRNDLHLIVIKLNVHDVGRSFQNLCKRSPCR